MFELIKRFFRRPQIPTVGEWCDGHLKEVEALVEAGKRSMSTLRSHRALVRHIKTHVGANLRADRVTPPDIVRAIKAMQAAGTPDNAVRIRRLMTKMHFELMESGALPASENPGRCVRPPPAPVRRSRLSFEDWGRLVEAAKASHEYLHRAMLLAIVTGQRRADIVKMAFDDIHDGCLHVVQQKTGVRLAIPLGLRCDAVGLSVDNVVEMCIDGTGNPYLIHTSIDPIRKLQAVTLSRAFTSLRDKVFTRDSWPGRTPPTFHEIRSLAERLYRDQGIDTKKLLGHRQQQMTDVYNNPRNLVEWITIPLPPQSGHNHDQPS